MDLSREELLSQLRDMDEYDFEHLFAEVWEQRGWQTTVTSGSSDRGIDVIAEKSSPFSQKQLIQVKRYSAGNKIGSPDIQQYSSLRQQEDDADTVVVVTTSSFSSQAEQIAQNLNVKLIDGGELCDIILELSSQSFLSNYFSTNIETKSESSGSTSDANSGSNRMGNQNNADTETNAVTQRRNEIENTSEGKTENNSPENENITIGGIIIMAVKLVSYIFISLLKFGKSTRKFWVYTYYIYLVTVVVLFSSVAVTQYASIGSAIVQQGLLAIIIFIVPVWIARRAAGYIIKRI